MLVFFAWNIFSRPLCNDLLGSTENKQFKKYARSDSEDLDNSNECGESVANIFEMFVAKLDRAPKSPNIFFIPAGLNRLKFSFIGLTHMIVLDTLECTSKKCTSEEQIIETFMICKQAM